MKFAFIHAEKANFPVAALCRVLGVTRQGYYASQKRGLSQRARNDVELQQRISVVHRESRKTYGSPRVRAQLRRDGLAVSKRRIERNMRELGLVGRKPRNVTHLAAASLTLVGGTVWESLVTRAQLTVGETVLVHGGAGGVGTIAIQVAAAIGARVITTAKGADHEFVRSLGADAAIDFTSTDYVDAVAELTKGNGVDVVLDTIGGDTLTRSPLALADGGRVVSIVDIAQPQNLIEAWGKNAAYHFVFTRQNRGKLDALTTLVERGLVKPVIGATLPLARIGEAHDILENRRSYALHGKVAIDVAGDTVALPPRAA